MVLGVVLGSVTGWYLILDDAPVLAIDMAPKLIAGVAVAVIVFSVPSCLAPIRRELRIQPTEALREG
jgi:ABC-type lipoprotein release transport system permease subunit